MKNNNFSIRYRCEICETHKLEKLYSFESFPVFMGCTDKNEVNDQLFPMSWVICKTCGVIQLDKLLPLDVIYQNSHGSGAVGSLWHRHHDSFADFISKFSPKSVLEIGGAHGILSDIYLSKTKINWTIIEPNPTQDRENKAKVIKGYFDKNFKIKDKVDAIIHSHVLEHIYNPITFMESINQFLLEDNLLIFSIPNMRVMLKNKYTNCINFEHTIYLDENSIEFLLNNNNFEIIDKKYFLEDHSIFFAAKKILNIKKISYRNKYRQNKTTYQNYLDFHMKLINQINSSMKTKPNNQYFLFGAHVFSQYLINFGLDLKNIIYILDNDQNKHDKRLYGSSLIVKSPEILKKYERPSVILRAGVYNDEIRKQILNINDNCEFI